MNKVKFAAQVAQLTADRVPFALATVVRARRPASVSPGDTAVVLADGTIDGFVGGQCAENSVRLYSLRALETGQPMLLRLLPEAPDGDQASDGLDGAVVEHNPCLSGGSLEIFIEPQLPPARVVITGESPIARALCRIASAADYVAESMPVPELDKLAGATAVIVASHGYHEEEVLTAALEAGVQYVALVASEKRGEAIRAELDMPPELATQLHTPAGVDIGADTPEEIAIAILAEMIVVQHSDPAVVGPPAPEQSDAMAVEVEVEAENGSAPAPEPVALAEVAPEQASVATLEQTDQESPDKKGSGDRHSGAAKLKRAFASGADRAYDPAEAAAIEARAAARAQVAAPPILDPDELEAAELEIPPGVEVAIDPICGMKVPITEATLHLDVAGSRQYFCGTGCRVAYAAKHASNVA